MSESFPIVSNYGSYTTSAPVAYSTVEYPTAVSGVESFVQAGSNLMGSQRSFVESRQSYVNTGSFLAPHGEPQLYRSEIEEAILNASDPLPLNEEEEVNVNGLQGYILNKQV